MHMLRTSFALILVLKFWAAGGSSQLADLHSRRINERSVRPLDSFVAGSFALQTLHIRKVELILQLSKKNSKRQIFGRLKTN